MKNFKRDTFKPWRNEIFLGPEPLVVTKLLNKRDTKSKE